MKYVVLFFFGVIFLGSPVLLKGQKIKVMSYNIRLDTPDDGVNIWENRKKEMAKLLKYYSPEIIGMQEVLPNQLQYLDEKLKHYTYIGVGRDDGKQQGEYAPIFYDTTQFLLIEASSFYLSETSEKVSMGWDAAYKRVCTYGLFENIDSKRRVLILNTHFDNKGEKAREMSAQLILAKIKKINIDGNPVIFMGDLNCEPDSKPIKILSNKLSSASEISEEGLYGPKGTFNGFNNNEIVEERIDYIFVSNLKVLDYAHIDDRMKNNNFISDHYPVLAKIKISGKK